MEESKQQIEQQNSVEISVNAKGLFSGKVKVYADTIDNAYNLALLKAELLATLIKTKNE